MALLDFPTGPQLNDTTTQNGNTWKWNGTSWVAFNNLSLTSQVTGVLGTVYGGTGKALSGLTVGSVLYADSSTSFAALSPGTSNYVLATQGNGSPPYWKVDDSGTGSVGSGITGCFAYYTGLNSITSGSGFSIIAGSGNGGTIIFTNGILSLIGSTINAGTWAGSAITLAYGGTNNNISGIGHSYRVAMYDAAGTAITNISSIGTGSSVLFQLNQQSAPVWYGQSQLFVGAATTAGSATTAANIHAGSAGNLHYQIAANSTGFITNAAGAGNSILSQNGNNAPFYLGQSQLIVGGATTAGITTNIGAGGAGSIPFNTASSTTTFLNHSGTASSVLVTTATGIGWTVQGSLFVGSASTAAQAAVDASIGTRYLLGTILNTATGATTISTGSGITIGNNRLSSENLVALGSTISTSTSTGALIVVGGVGIGGSLWTNSNNFSSISGVGHSNSTITSGTWAGNAITLTYGGTNNNISGIGHSYRVAMYDAAGAAITNISSAGTASSVLFQLNQQSAPVWIGQSQLVVGGATTAGISTNIGQGGIGSIPYNTASSTTTFLNHSGTGNSILVTTGAGIGWTARENTTVGSATNATNATNTNITDDTSTSSQQYITWVGGTTGNQAQKVTSTKLLFTPSTGKLEATSFSGSGLLLSGIITSLSTTAGSGIILSASTGPVTIANIGVTSISGTTNQISASASTGIVQLSLPQDIATTSSPAFANLTISNGNTSTLATVGSSATSMVNKQYVDNLAAGLDIHASVRAIQTSAIGASYLQPFTGSGVGASLWSTSFGTFPNVDGVVFSATGTTQRILIAGGATGKTNYGGSATWGTPTNLSTTASIANGIYYLLDKGSAGSNWILVRATDTDESTELTAGTFTFVEEGTVYADTGWVCTNDTTNLGPIQFGLDNATTGAINFTQFTGAQALSMGQGLSRAGNTIATTANIATHGTYTVGVGFTAFTIGGALSGIAGTTFNATLRVGSTVANGSGTAAISLNTVGFSMTGGTQTVKGLTVIDDMTLSGAGNSLTLTGSILFPAPTSNGIAYGSSGLAVAFLTAGGAGASVLTQTSGSAPVYLGQSQLVVGGATTAGISTNIGAGGAGSIPFNTASSTTTFLNHSGTASSVLVTTATGIGWTVQGSLFVGSASTTAQAAVDASIGTRYLLGTILNTATGATTISTGSGITIGNNRLSSENLVALGSTISTSTTTGALIVAGGVGIGGSLWTNSNNFSSISGVGHSNSTITSGTWAGNAITLTYGGTNNTVSGIGHSYRVAMYDAAGFAITNISSVGTASSVLFQLNQQSAPVWYGQSQLIVGGATTAGISTNIGAGGAGSIPFNTAVSTTTFLNHSGTASSVLVTTATGIGWTVQGSLIVGSASTTAQVAVDASIGTRYLVGTILNTATGATTISTGSGITIGNNRLSSENLVALGATISTSTSTGALIVNGGVGIGGSLWTGSANYSQISGLGIISGIVTSGLWAGTAISLINGGTNNNIAGNGHSNKVAVYNASGSAITAYTITQGNIIFGATGGTYAGLASTLIPVTAISDTPPAQPGGAIGATQSGQLWWDSQYGALKVYYNDGNTSQWVDATPVLGSSGGGSSTKRSYVMSFGAGFTPTVGADTVQILIPHAPDNTSKFYYIKRLNYRNETVSGGTGASFYIERFTGGNAAFSSPERIYSAGAGAGASFIIGASTYTASWTLASTGASFISSGGVAGSVISGDYLRLNFTTVGSAAAVSVSMIIEEQ